MGKKKDMLRELAGRIYDLDVEVYEKLGSSLGRVFNQERERCIKELMKLMDSKSKSHILRSQLALISNMARTIEDDTVREVIMKKYEGILQEVTNLPKCFASEDILDEKIAQLNEWNLEERFSKDNRLVICIGRAYGCGGSEIGFVLADALKINYYDVEIFNEVLRRMELGREMVEDQGGVPSFQPAPKFTVGQWIKDVKRYHGLPRRDAVFFDQCDLICDMARREDFVVMGRCADAILTNNHIPHISIYITAPFEQRVRRMMKINKKMSEKQVRELIRRLDKKHARYYEYYTGRRWGAVENYDLCINSASYGIDGSVELIRRMIKKI